MSEATERAMNRLVADFPQFAPILNEHLDANLGEMLPHLFLGEIMERLEKRVAREPAACRSVLAWLEAAFEQGPEDVSELVVVSGVEAIPSPGKPGSELRALLGPRLRKVDPWNRYLQRR